MASQIIMSHVHGPNYASNKQQLHPLMFGYILSVWFAIEIPTKVHTIEKDVMNASYLLQLQPRECFGVVVWWIYSFTAFRRAINSSRILINMEIDSIAIVFQSVIRELHTNGHFTISYLFWLIDAKVGNFVNNGYHNIWCYQIPKWIRNALAMT